MRLKTPSTPNRRIRIDYKPLIHNWTMKKFLTFIMMLVVSTSLALAKDIETVVFTTQPQMHCSNCEAKIKKALRFEKGVKDIVTNVPQQTVTVKYDEDKTTVAKLIKALEKIDYNVRVVAASDDDVRCKYNVKCNKQTTCNKDKQCCKSKCGKASKCDKAKGCDKAKSCCGK